MSNNDQFKISPLPDKAESDYGSFRIRLLEVVAGANDDHRYVMLNFLNTNTGQEFSRTYETTKEPGKFVWAGDEMSGGTGEAGIISNLNALTEKIGPENVQRLKEHLGVGVEEVRSAIRGL